MGVLSVEQDWVKSNNAPIIGNSQSSFFIRLEVRLFDQHVLDFFVANHVTL